MPYKLKMSVEERSDVSCKSLSVLATFEARFEPKPRGDLNEVTLDPRGDLRPDTSCCGAESP